MEFKFELFSDYHADSPMKKLNIKITKYRKGGTSNNDVVRVFACGKSDFLPFSITKRELLTVGLRKNNALPDDLVLVASSRSLFGNNPKRPIVNMICPRNSEKTRSRLL